MNIHSDTVNDYRCAVVIIQYDIYVLEGPRCTKGLLAENSNFVNYIQRITEGCSVHYHVRTLH